MAEHVAERWGTNDLQLDCPVCGWSGTVYYNRRRPVYCSDACKQKAYRQRKAAQNVTSDDDQAVTNLSKPRIERALDQALHLLRCGCGRGIWTVKGNVQIGELHCGLCGELFKGV